MARPVPLPAAAPEAVSAARPEGTLTPAPANASAPPGPKDSVPPPNPAPGAAPSLGPNVPVDEAPEPWVGNSPDEVELAPPPDAEKVQLPPGFVEIPNPAFPAPPPREELSAGPRLSSQDVAPYFADGPLAQAKADYDQGQFEDAEALLAAVKDPSPPVRYLLGLCRLKAGDAAGGVNVLLPLLTAYPAMKERVLAHAALAEEQLQDWQHALDLYGQIPASSRLYPDALFGSARALHHLGKLAEAVRVLEPLLSFASLPGGRDYAAEALLARADLDREAHNGAAERDGLWQLWSAHPTSPLARQAERRLRGIKPPVPVQVARAEALIEAHRNRPGMRLLQPLLPFLKLIPGPKDPPEQHLLACRAHLAYGKALRKEREHTRVEPVLERVVQRCAFPDLRARAMYILGSSQSIVDPKAGARTYEALAHDFPSSPLADDALYYAADLYAKQGDIPSALARLQEIIDHDKGGDFYSEALFKAFWIHRMRHEEAQALQVLDTVEKELSHLDDSYDLERERYWRGRMAEADHHQPEAEDLYTRLAEEHPSTYYGLLARTRLEIIDASRAQKVLAEVGKRPPSPGPWSLHAGALMADPHFKTALELLRMGFGDAAANELLAVNRNGEGEEPIELLVQLLADAGDLRDAHAIARISLRRSLGGPLRAENLAVWELAYPPAFRDEVVTRCKASGVDPDLLQALMREESALDPRALSWAGALGLTQLMLPTARVLAHELHLKKAITAESLLNPELNIRLGAYYLGRLLNRFGGNDPYAIASYNAGANAVERWIEDKRGLELDEWVEEIPIAETRGYVKRVLRSYNTYQLLSGHPSFLAGYAVPSAPTSDRR